MFAITRLAAPVTLTMLLVTTAARAEDKPGFLGVQLKADDNGKIQITGLAEDGPAGKAGLKADDVIVKLDGKDVGDIAEFVKAIKAHKAGDKIALQVLRDGKEMEVKITLGEAPPDK
jgi:S1-C subfamily serine protease